jgi:hypothetical protein
LPLTVSFLSHLERELFHDFRISLRSSISDLATTPLCYQCVGIRPHFETTTYVHVLVEFMPYGCGIWGRCKITLNNISGCLPPCLIEKYSRKDYTFPYPSVREWEVCSYFNFYGHTAESGRMQEPGSCPSGITILLLEGIETDSP